MRTGRRRSTTVQPFPGCLWSFMLPPTRLASPRTHGQQDRRERLGRSPAFRALPAVPLACVVADDVIVTSHVVGIAGILTPVLTPCTIDLTSRGQPKHRPNGMKGARLAVRKTRRPRSRDHVTACVLRSWTGLADRAPRRDLGRAGNWTDPRTDEGPESAGGSVALAEPAPWTLGRSSGTNVPSGRPSMRRMFINVNKPSAWASTTARGQCGRD